MNIDKYAGDLKGVKDIPDGDVNNLIPEPIKPLLVIELEDESAVPKVFYQGEEITAKVSVSFDWETDGLHPTDGGLTYAIEHVDMDADYPVTNRIERKVKGHCV